MAAVDSGESLIVAGEVMDAGVHREGEPVALCAAGLHDAG